MLCAVYGLWIGWLVPSSQYGTDAMRTSAGREVGRWPWTGQARRTVVTAPFTMYLGCVRCRAALSTGCKKYARDWVDSAPMRAMTRVRVHWRSRLGARVTSPVVAAC